MDLCRVARSRRVSLTLCCRYVNSAHHLVDLVQAKQNTSKPDTREIDEELLRRILAHLRVRTGHDFSKYKQSTVLRRIARRMQVNRCEELKSYYEHLRDNVDEAQALLSDLLISVTTFFRDTDAFQALSSHVLPALFKERDSNEAIREWACGCATGEEAYTMAILRGAASRQRRTTVDQRRISLNFRGARDE